MATKTRKKDKLTFQRYWNEGHRKENKLRRIRKCNGERAAEEYERRYVGATLPKKAAG